MINLLAIINLIYNTYLKYLSKKLLYEFQYTEDGTKKFAIYYIYIIINNFSCNYYIFTIFINL